MPLECLTSGKGVIGRCHGMVHTKWAYISYKMCAKFEMRGRLTLTRVKRPSGMTLLSLGKEPAFFFSFTHNVCTLLENKLQLLGNIYFVVCKCFEFGPA